MTVSDDILNWQRIIEDKFSLDESLISVNPRSWQRILQPMTLGGMFVVVTAFGCIKQPFMPISSAVSVKNLSPSDWLEIVQRAIPRLTAFESGCGGEVLSSSVAQHLLLRLLNAHVANVDQQTALGMLVRMFDTKVDCHLLGQYPHLGQQQLF
jgi:hypothetical protein